MAQVIHNPISRPSMCHEPPTAQIATALGDLCEDFRLVQGLVDFLEEEVCRLNHTAWPVMRPYLLALALDHRVDRFSMNLGAVAGLVQEGAR
jgi:hypothetical protein